MNKVLKISLVRIPIAILFVGIGITAGQMILNLLRSMFSITNTSLANLLAFVLAIPTTYGAYWIYVHYLEKRIGLIHLTSSGARIFSAAAVALQAGLILAATYALTHRLWMALGLHAMWDFANDGIFGVGLAGQTGQSIQGLLQARLSGPDLITGGSFGVEASVITLILVTIAGILILWRAYQKGQFVAHGNRSAIRMQAARSKSES